MSNKHVPLKEEEIEHALVNHRPTRKRWYILFIFSMLTLMQGTIWNSWSPVAESAKAVFPTWSDGTIALLINWGPITYLVFILPICWGIEASLRNSMLLCVTLMVLGTGLRCIPLQLSPDSWWNNGDVFVTSAAHICAIFNGIAGIVCMAAPPAISAVWFPPYERTTATGIGQIASIFAVSNSFLMGVEIVKDVPPKANGSSQYLMETNEVDPTLLGRMRHEIMWLMWAQALPVFVLAVFTCLHFPNKPVVPSSRSSEIPRLDFGKGIIKVLKNPNAYLIAMVIGLPNAVLAGWVTLMSDFLPMLCFMEGPAGHQHQACLSPSWINWLGVVTNLAAGVGALLVARLMDMLRGHLKKSVVILFILATIGFTLLSLVSLQVWKFHHLKDVEIAIYVLLPLSTAFVAATIPLCTELAVEICFPSAEIVVSGWITVWVNILAMVFYFMFQIPGIGTNWLNYVLPISMAVTIPFALLVKDEYKRSDIDLASQTPDNLSHADSTIDIRGAHLRFE